MGRRYIALDADTALNNNLTNLSFPNANEKVYFNPYIYAKAMKKP